MDQRRKRNVQQAELGLRFQKAKHQRSSASFARHKKQKRETIQTSRHESDGHAGQERRRVRGAEQKALNRTERSSHFGEHHRRLGEDQDRSLAQSVRLDKQRLGQHIQDFVAWCVR